MTPNHPDERPDDQGADVTGDARERPADPAGTRPRHDPRHLLPSQPLPPLERLGPDVVDGEAIDDGQEEPGPFEHDDDLLPERRAAGGIGAVRAASVPAPHAPRFHFLYGALAAIAAAVVAAGVIALVGGAGTGHGASDKAKATWSTWHPTLGSLAGAGQIAGHIGQQYRLTDGRQLVNVQASSLSFEGIPLSVAIRQTPQQGGDIRVYQENGLIYRLCGLGSNCSISTGKPSTQRYLLLKREALELALYSFRYLDKIDQVVVLMPPPPNQKPSQAVFFRRGDVNAQLDRPLHASLSSQTPSVRTVGRAADSRLVARLTGVHLFTFSLTQANTENRGFLVLDPIPASAAGK
jgi:hypothetical protein